MVTPNPSMIPSYNPIVVPVQDPPISMSHPGQNPYPQTSSIQPPPAYSPAPQQHFSQPNPYQPPVPQQLKPASSSGGGTIKKDAAYFKAVTEAKKKA